MAEQNDPGKEPASVRDSRFKVDPGGVLTEFEAAVLEECIAEAMSIPLSDLFRGTEDQWHYGPTVGNA
jgi:hypothetical protein